MIGAASLLLALGLGVSATPVADFDIPYFLANPKIHEETLRRCHDDVRAAMTAECENAERAGSRRIGRPLSRLIDPWKKQAAPAVKPAPLLKGKDRGA